jgi:hypothetical protein
MLFIVFLIAFSFRGMAGPDSKSGKGSILIVEEPGPLVLYNSYQQSVGRAEKTALGSFTPFRILEQNETLSDGFTPCLKVESGGIIFYMVKDSGGRPIGMSRAGFSTTLSDVTFVGDTIAVLGGGSLKLTTPQKSGSLMMRRGEQVARIFRYRDLTYVRRHTNPPTYGWVTLADRVPNPEWKIYGIGETPLTSVPADLTQRIEAKTTEANTLIQRLFASFNRRSGQHRAFPQWRVEAHASTIICTLGPLEPGEDFPHSTAILARDLESALLGSTLRVFHSRGRIEIRSMQP